MGVFFLLLIDSEFVHTKDNCPPGGAIAYPVIHQQAGGVGTFQDPITYAGDVDVTPAGTM